MLNSHCNKNGKKKKKKEKKICDYRDPNPGSMGSKSTKVSTTLWRLMELSNKNNIR